MFIREACLVLRARNFVVDAGLLTAAHLLDYIDFYPFLLFCFVARRAARVVEDAVRLVAFRVRQELRFHSDAENQNDP